MALPKIEEFIRDIADLSNRPNDIDGLTAQQLKDRFDENPEKLRVFINSVIDKLNATTNMSGAEQIGSKTIVGLTGNTIYAQLLSIKQELDGKAGTTDFLKKDNTDPFTPTDDYNPSTKKYVDDTVAGVVMGEIPDDSLTEVKMVDAMKKQAGGVYPYDDGAINRTSTETNKTNIETVKNVSKFFKASSVSNLYMIRVDTKGAFKFEDGAVLRVIPYASSGDFIRVEVDGTAKYHYIKKYDVDTNKYIDMGIGGIIKNIPIQLVWDETQNFFVYAPKGGASKLNYKKAGYPEPFLTVINDGSDLLPTTFANTSAQWNARISANGRYYSCAYMTYPKSTIQASYGVVTYDLVNNTHFRNDATIWTSNIALSSDGEFANGTFLSKGGNYLQGWRENGGFIGSWNMSSMNVEMRRGCYFEDKFYYVDFSNKQFSYVTQNAQSTVKSAGQMSLGRYTWLRKHGDFIYSFSSDSTQVGKYKPNPDGTLQHVAFYTRDTSQLSEIVSGKSSNRDRFYALINQSSQTKIIMYNGSGAKMKEVIVGTVLSNAYCLSFSDDKVYVVGNSRDNLYTGVNMLLCYDWELNEQLYKVTSGIGDSGLFPMAVRNGVVMGYISDRSSGANHYTHKTPFKVITEDMMKKNELIATIQK